MEFFRDLQLFGDTENFLAFSREFQELYVIWYCVLILISENLMACF